MKLILKYGLDAETVDRILGRKFVCDFEFEYLIMLSQLLKKFMTIIVCMHHMRQILDLVSLKEIG